MGLLSAPGKIENLYTASPITLKTTLQTPEAFGAMPIKSDGDNIIRLRDVARVELGAVNKDTIVSFNGASGTFLGIFPTPAANPIDMTAAVRKELPSIQATLPEGMQLYMVYDSTEQISSSIEEVFKTIGEAVLIVVAVILLFLGSFRSVIIPVVTIPISLIGVCFFLFMLGYSINLLSLLAMVLAIGLVVDDAIVVLENIHRHIEEGLRPLDAALKGMKEITGPIVAMTITLAAVFAPLGFTGGLTGSLFREFAFTLAGAVIISGVAALTVSPMMCALLLRAGGHSRFQRIVDRSFGWLEGAYERRVAGSLNFRFVTLFIVVALVALTGFLLTKTNSELAPEEDSGALFAIVNGPQYATSQYTKLYADQIDALTKDLPELKTRFNILGFGTTNSAFAIWVFKDWSERTKSQAQLKAELQGMISPLAGVEAFIFAPPGLAGYWWRVADFNHYSVDRPGRQGVRSRRRDQEQGASLGAVHHRAKLALVQRAASHGYDRSRSGLGVGRARKRYWPDTWAVGRWRQDLEIRSGFQQLRHHSSGAAGLQVQS